MTDQPNIMLLVAEDTGRHHGCYGDPCGKTPAIDQLAAEGARYTHAFSTASVCAPSRASLVTGKTSFSQGNHHMRSTLINPPPLFTEKLRQAGYYVNWSNKTDFNFKPPESFADDTHEWFDELAEGRIPNQPWLLYHNFGATHESGMWPKKWKDRCGPVLSEDEYCDPATVRVPSYLPDTPEVRADIARYYDNLTLQDKQVAHALETLDKYGQRDNTIVIYLSDHGRGLLREKRWCYDAGLHLPLIVRAPGLTEPGSVNSELVSWLDIAPTLLDLAGAETVDDAQGRIFLGTNQQPAPEYVIAGRDRMEEVFDRVRTARSKRFHYIRNDFPELPYGSRMKYMENQATTQAARRLYAEGRLEGAAALYFTDAKPPVEFYDCDADPENVHNLADDPLYADAIAAHAGALDDFLTRTGDLGERPERELIDEGILTDILTYYSDYPEPLPEDQRIAGIEIPPMEMP